MNLKVFRGNIINSIFVQECLKSGFQVKNLEDRKDGFFKSLQRNLTGQARLHSKQSEDVLADVLPQITALPKFQITVIILVRIS